MKPDEFQEVTGQTIYVSATPAAFELEKSARVVEQLIRPTGLLDPEMEIRPIKGQVEDCIEEIKKEVEKGNRVLVTTLTKRMSEDLTEFLREREIKVEYLHSDIDAIERVEILRNLRAGAFDVLIGVNLLRKGWTCLRFHGSGARCRQRRISAPVKPVSCKPQEERARHLEGRVIFYADQMTKSLQAAWDICTYRREKQMLYNKQNGISPKSVNRPIQESLRESLGEDKEDLMEVSEAASSKDLKKLIKQLEAEMLAQLKN